MKRRAIALAAATVTLGGAGVAALAGGPATEQQNTVNLRLSYVTTQQHPYGQAVDYFISEVDKASNGRIKITGQPSYPNSEVQLLSDTRSGTVDMATMSTAIWDSAGINSFQALQAPFLVSNYGLEGKILNGTIGKRMIADATTRAGDVKVLAVHEGGLRKPLGAKKALTSPAAFKGLSIRAVQSKVLSAGLKALGAEPDPLPLPEVYQALQNGTVDGMEANLGLIAGNKYFEVAKYVTGNVNFWPFPTALTINAAKFNSLSAADQKILTDAAAKVAAKSLSIVSAKSTLPQDLVNCGIKFVYASPKAQADFQKLGAKAIASLSKDATTGKFIKQIQAVKKAMPAGPKPPPFPSKKTGACTLGS